ncbi:hypothetical protein [Oceanobacillus sp. ISL-73]|uniref:hypothetical protein n=1 Tax=Oceanobacillus sp. ISL-73 TaxID=2819161 RepID=UPI001BE7A016|nr:hypothetical protein [Oceanobacillus sp. ISL-73]MBT2652765.1 hypothetical protein [Oceanobacillus sp. ISL-73]
MFKKGFALIVMSCAFIFAFTGFSSTAFADDASIQNVKMFKFKTGDGQWDGSISSSRMFDVNIEVDAPHAATIQVRLCNANSGNCTPYKWLTLANRTEFLSMLPGTYYGDIVVRGFNQTSGTVTYRGGFDN